MLQAFKESKSCGTKRNTCISLNLAVFYLPNPLFLSEVQFAIQPADSFSQTYSFIQSFERFETHMKGRKKKKTNRFSEISLCSENPWCCGLCMYQQQGRLQWCESFDCFLIHV